MFLSIKKNKKWSSLYKTFIWAASLSLAALLGFNWFGIITFLAVSVGIYFSQSHNRIDFRAIYWLFSFASFGVLFFQINALNPFSSLWISFILIAVLTAVFFLIQKLIDYQFVNQSLFYSVISTAVLIVIFVNIFSLSTPFSLGLTGILIFFSLAWLFYENLRLISLSPKRSLLTSSVPGFLGIELVWVVLVLPLGILNSTALLTLFFVILRDFLISHFKGLLNKELVFKQFTVLILLSIIILAASQWSL